MGTHPKVSSWHIVEQLIVPPTNPGTPWHVAPPRSWPSHDSCFSGSRRPSPHHCRCATSERARPPRRGRIEALRMSHPCSRTPLIRMAPRTPGHRGSVALSFVPAFTARRRPGPGGQLEPIDTPSRPIRTASMPELPESTVHSPALHASSMGCGARRAPDGTTVTAVKRNARRNARAMRTDGTPGARPGFASGYPIALPAVNEAPKRETLDEYTSRVRRCEARASCATLSGSTGAPMSAVGRGRLLRLAGDERIEHREPGEAREVTIGRPELTDAVELADGGDAGIVDPRPDALGGDGDARQDWPVACWLAEDDDARRGEPRVHLVESAFQ